MPLTYRGRANIEGRCYLYPTQYIDGCYSGTRLPRQFYSRCKSRAKQMPLIFYSYWMYSSFSPYAMLFSLFPYTIANPYDTTFSPCKSSYWYSPTCKSGIFADTVIYSFDTDQISTGTLIGERSIVLTRRSVSALAYFVDRRGIFNMVVLLLGRYIIAFCLKIGDAPKVSKKKKERISALPLQKRKKIGGRVTLPSRRCLLPRKATKPREPARLRHTCWRRLQQYQLRRPKPIRSSGSCRLATTTCRSRPLRLL